MPRKIKNKKKTNKQINKKKKQNFLFLEIENFGVVGHPHFGQGVAAFWFRALSHVPVKY